MPAVLGFILGVALTIAGAYAYDSSTGRVPNGLTADSAERQAPMVNWNVVSDDWTHFQAKVRSKAERLEESFKRHTG